MFSPQRRHFCIKSIYPPTTPPPVAAVTLPLKHTVWLASLAATGALFALPLTHLHDPKHYTRIEISRQLLPASPADLRQRSIFLGQTHSKARLHAPNALLSWLEELSLPFDKLSPPTKFIELNPDHTRRLNAKCPPSRNMLDGYKSVELNKKYLTCLGKEFPTIAKRIKIGNSRKGRGMYALRLRLPPQTQTTAPKNPTEHYRDPVFIQCAVHGDEPIAIEHCYDIMIETLNHPHRYPYLADMELWILPITNPDGVHRFWQVNMKAGRKNGYYSGKARQAIHEGVDLNRNFPFRWNSGNPKASSGNPGSYYYRGPAPASEPETRAILRLFERQRFIAALSYHCYANAILSPYTIEGTQNPQPDLAGELAGRMLPNAISYQEKKPFVVKKNLYEVDGTDTDTYYHHFGTLAFLVESSHLLQPYEDVPTILTGLRPVWENFLHELHQTPFIRLKITDENGRPLVARIESDAFVFSEGEERYSGEDGIARLPAPSLNAMRLKITAAGYPEYIITLQPTQARQFQHIILRR